MTRSPLPHLVRRALARHALADTPDADLLARFRRDRDPQAFAELVERYAPLVWGVCRRVLTDSGRAEDAFQATFITLARKAAAVRQPDRLAGWLHGVARRTAWQHRDSGRIGGVVPDRPSDEPSPLDQVTGKELVAAIETEVDRLPEKYRSAVLVCWVEDCSLPEAARRLGVTPGVLWGRLRYAREKLKARLVRRGLGLPAVLGAGVIGSVPASARLVERTIANGLGAPAETVATGVLGLVPVVKPVGLAALAAAVVISIVTLMPAGAPDAPPKDAPKSDGTTVVVTKVNDGIPLPAGAVHRFGNRLARHPDGINGVTVSPDGKLAATIGQSSVIVWDLKTMAAKCIFRDQVSPGYYGDSAARVGFFPDSKQVLVAVYPGNNYYIQVERGQKVEVARVYDVETGKLKFAVKGDADYWTGAWLTAKGKEIAVYAQQAVTFYDATSGKELRKVACGPERNGLLAVAPEANLLAMRRNDNNTLTLVDAATGQRPEEITVETIGRVTFTPDGKRLAVSDGAGKVHIRDVKAKKELFAFAAPAGKGVVAMRFSADQQTLFIGGQHGRMYRWDLKNNKKLPDVGSHSTWSLTSLVVSPDETMLYSTANDKLIKRWDLKTLKEVPAPDGYITQTAVVPLPDRKTMLVADHQGALDRWDLASGKHVGRLQGKSNGIDCVAVSADGRWFAGGRTTQDVTLWDLKAGKAERVIPLVEKPNTKGSDHVRRVAFSGDGKVLFTGSGQTGITAWEVPTGKKLWNAPGIGPYLAVDPQGRWVAAGGGYNRDQVQWTLLSHVSGDVLRRVDVVPQQQTDGAQQMIHYPAYLGDLRFTPDGSRLVTSHYDQALRLWDPGTGREVARLTGTGHGGGLAVSADGRWAGVGQQDKKITVWELATGKKVLELTGHDSNVRDVAFTPDGKGILGNADLAPVLWALDPKDNARPDAGTWDVLTSDDGAKAYRAQWALVRDPAAAVKLFGEKVKPAELALDRAMFDKWVADLDSPQFRLREVAERELTRAGLRVPLSWLRKALSESKGDEPRARLGRVLVQREKPNPEEWRLGRAVQVLELAGTPEAVALLKAWAGVDGSPVTEASREAVGRMGRP